MIEIDQHALRHASCRANHLVRSGAIPAADWEDARQELLLDLLQRERKFDPARGDWAGFIHGIMRNHATILATRMKRRAQHEILVDHNDADGDWMLPALVSANPVGAIELRIDVQRVVAGLPMPLKRVAFELTELSVVEICALMGKSRSRIYQMVGRIRVAFIEAGIGSPCSRLKKGIRLTYRAKITKDNAKSKYG